MNELIDLNDIDFSGKCCQADELIKALNKLNNRELKFVLFAMSERKKGEIYVETTVNELLKSVMKHRYGGSDIKKYLQASKSIRQKSDITVETTIDRLPLEKAIKLGLDPDSTNPIQISGPVIVNTIRDEVMNTVLIEFNEAYLPLMEDLRHDYTWMYLEQIARLEGKYSPRLYEFLKMILKDRNKAKFIWYLDAYSNKAPCIRQWFDLVGKYGEWRDLNRRVLKPAFEEINEKVSDLRASYTPLKTTNNWPHVYAIEVVINSKHKNKKIEEKNNKKLLKGLPEWWGQTNDRPPTEEEIKTALRLQMELKEEMEAEKAKQFANDELPF